jgi:hypothetical protein
MGDAASGLIGFALIVALFVGYAMQRRGQSTPADSAAETPAPADASVPAGTSSEPAPAERRGSSPNWGAPILFVALLFGAASQGGNAWGYLWQALYWALILLGAYTAFSAKELAAERRRDPAATRMTQSLTYGIPYVLIPVVAWVAVILLDWRWGVFLPLAPWALLAVIAVVAVASGVVRGRAK